MEKEKMESQVLEDQRKTLEIYSKLLEQSNQNFEEKVKELSILRHMGDSLLYARDIKKIGKVILEVIVEEFNTEFGSLMLLNKADNVLKLFAATSQMEEVIKYFDDSEQILIPVGQGVAGCAAAEKKSMLIPDTEKDERFIARSSGRLIRSMLSMPMIAKNEVIGVINLSSPIKNAFSEKEERIMKIVSDQAALALENAMLVREQVRTERMSAIGNMAATLVHDIKNPMTKLKGFAEIMADPDITQEEREEFAQIIVSEIERFVNMTEELLEFSRGGESKLNLEVVMTEDFLKGVLPFLKRDFADAKIELITSIECNAPLNIDIQKFQRVFFNLTGNAKDAMPDGGKLEISTLKKNNMIVISICDTGKGIPANIKDKLFVPFVTYGKTKGTGLGLAIVKKIVEEHEGEIHINSEAGKGAEFIIALPIHKE